MDSKMHNWQKFLDTPSKRKREFITRLWREHGHGRLYWKRNNSHWRDWASENIAQARDGAVRVYFNSYEAIMDYLGIRIENGS